MRSSIANKRNPWPRDMVIGVGDDNELMALLYLRHAWQLNSEVDLPSLDPLPASGDSIRPFTVSLEEWNRRWMEAWTRTWDWYRGTDGQRRAAQQAVQESNPWPGEEEPPEWVLELWAKTQQGWSAAYGLDGIDTTAYNRWRAHLRPDPLLPRRNSPEHRSLPALIAAWKSGLKSVTLLPYRGYYAERVSAKHLMVSIAARSDPASYSQALATGVAQ